MTLLLTARSRAFKLLLGVPPLRPQYSPCVFQHLAKHPFSTSSSSLNRPKNASSPKAASKPVRGHVAFSPKLAQEALKITHPTEPTQLPSSAPAPTTTTDISNPSFSSTPAAVNESFTGRIAPTDNTSATSSQPGQRYPKQLLIYHAGKGRLLFLAFFKLTSVFVFLFATFLVAPQYYFSAFEPTWMAPIVILGGAIPFAVMSLYTAPYVAWVHLHLPLWARNSSTRLQAYAAALPSSARIDVTSVRWLWGRRTQIKAGELYIHQAKNLGTISLGRNVPAFERKNKPWYAGKPVSRFLVGGNTAGHDVPDTTLWESVLSCVVKGWEKRPEREKLFVSPVAAARGKTYASPATNAKRKP